MNASHAMPWSELVREVARMCNERRTGTLFIATNDNRLARIALKDGVIAAVEFQRKQGLAAVKLMQGITGGTWRFNDELMMVGSAQSLPSTPGVLKMLADKSDVNAADMGADAYAPATQQPAQSSPTTSGLVNTTTQRFSYVDVSELLQIKDLITAELISIIGPMGKLVGEEHLATLSDRRSVMLAIDRVAAEIDDPDLERQFKLSLAEKLQALQRGGRR
ncbi:MAG TPA: hypothetical protein PLQ67_02165 [Burkholderiaceae bacterium]|nr:hypothetical protein [Burkholderiaceae bacterium]